MNARRYDSGVSLIELLTVMTLAAILMSIAVPSFKYVTVSNRISAEINGLLGDMQYARYQAIKEGLPVTICPTASATSTTCDSTTTWSGGWIVLSNAGVNSGAASGAVLRRQPPFNASNSTDVLTASSGVTSVVFNREGFAMLTGTAMFSLHDAGNTSAYTRCLITNAVGSMATTTAGNAVNSVTCS